MSIPKPPGQLDPVVFGRGENEQPVDAILQLNRPVAESHSPEWHPYRLDAAVRHPVALRRAPRIQDPPFPNRFQ
jgi:hypothetical protein